MNALDPTKFAAAKLNLLLGVGLDAELPKLALRVANVLVGQYMCADNGGEAWPAIKRLCGDLGIASESKVRDALYALLERSHLVAERKAGGTTRYRIAERYFDGGTQHEENSAQPQNGAGSRATQPEGGADTQPQNGATPQPQNGAGSPPRHGATNSGNITPGNELRELNSGKDSPSSPSHAQKPASEKASEPPTPRKTKFPPDGFEEFWNAYPLRVEKLAAMRAFVRAVRSGAPPEQITAAAKRFAAKRALVSDPEERERYTPHPAKWLNGGRWTDEPAPQASTSFEGLPIVGGAPLRRIPREGHGFRIMRVEEFLQ
ncbi:MAG: hypothetical protein AB7F41_10675 [Methylocystis sp.]|uniref:hypothetical protein n=1 Tax=Methylocystis sp. TaxID=1911079 RepID=UPI003D09CB45